LLFIKTYFYKIYLLDIMQKEKQTCSTYYDFI
jgi:hypothetical protein